MHTYICLYREVCLSSRRFLTGGFCPGLFVWKVLSGVVFVHLPFCQNTYNYNRKPNITFNFRFHMYKNLFKCDVTCSWTLPCHRLSHLLGSPPLERDVLYGRPRSRGLDKAL